MFNYFVYKYYLNIKSVKKQESKLVLFQINTTFQHFEYWCLCTTLAHGTQEGERYFQEDGKLSISSWMYVFYNL